MATYYLTTSGTFTTYIQAMAAGDYVYVAGGVNLFGGNSVNGYGLYDTSYGTAEIAGTIIGTNPLYFDGVSNYATDISIDQGGKVVSNAAGGTALTIYSGLFNVYNNGQITTTASGGGTSYGIYLAYYVQSGIIVNNGNIQSGGVAIADLIASTTVSDVLYNYGQIFGTQAATVNSEDNMTIYNYGSIGSNDTAAIANAGAVTSYGILNLDNFGQITGGVLDTGPVGGSIYNTGSIQGNITLVSGTVNSQFGTIAGAVTFTGGSGTTDVVIAGQDGGAVTGGAGTDVFYANTAPAAANNGATTTLDGKTGNNWLFGDGAYTTFDSGDNSSGTYNFITGGASQMAGVTGYANNSLNYSTMSSAYKSAYIDLLGGYTYMSTVAHAVLSTPSQFVIEDFFQNVPNAVGSSGSDVIICDNGVDKITVGSGNTGGDVLYAGTGASSQDTFAFTSLSQSPDANAAAIEGFKVGTDKIDLSALGLPAADIGFVYAGSGYTSILVEKNPSAGFNLATDMLISVAASTSAAVSIKDIIL